MDAFDEDTLWANLKEGGLEITGENLNVEKLDLQDGILIVTGEIREGIETGRAAGVREGIETGRAAGIREGIETGRTAGIQEGRTAALRTIVRNLAKQNIPVQQIAEAAGVDEATVREWIEEKSEQGNK